MNDETADPHGRMLQMITSYWVTQVIRGAASASLADRLADGPKTAAELAQAGALHPEVAVRFLRACATLGLVAAAPDDRFAATPLLDTLRTNAPGSMRGLALSQAAPGHWLPWGRFPDVLATGRRQTVEALGAEVFDYYAANPAEADEFSRGMSGITATVARDVAKILDTEAVSLAVDIGGAEGALLRALMAVNPRPHGIVFDRPGIVPSARRALEVAGLADRVAIVEGDFFAEVPAGDLYLLKHILHDWDDEHSLAILRNCRKAARPGARIAVIEFALGEAGEPGPGALMDLNMLVLTSGRERTFAEYRALLAAAGFGDARATPTGGPMVVVEARAAP